MQQYEPAEFVFKLSEYTIAYKSLSNEQHVITGPEKAFDLMKPHFQAYHGIREAMFAMYLNHRNGVIGIQRCAEGSMNGCIADPRIIIKVGLDLLCSGIILFHNHPSGNLKPSEADKQLTQKVKEAAKFFDIKLTDHIIITEEAYLSMTDEGII